MKSPVYIAIDLKSFYASVECMERGLNSLTTNLVVADPSRTSKTICLAVSPCLKAYGVSGRPRLFEVEQCVKQINALRLAKAGGQALKDSSYDDLELKSNPNLSLGYITAQPQMAKYIEYSSRIYNIYLKYFAPEDIHVYSIDEVFIEITNYLKAYKLSPKELVSKILKDVRETTGITATAGIGTNLYLAKIAMDILAKKQSTEQPDQQIATLDEESYRRQLWDHRPITDFWRVGKGYATRLAKMGLFTMGDVARCSIGRANDYLNESLLYKAFGVNAELLIDHAWGWESCEMSDIKKYKPQAQSVSSGQVLHTSYSYEEAKIIIWEMADMLALDLLDKSLITNQIVLTVSYDIENLIDPEISCNFQGEVAVDGYGRRVPKSAHGTINLGCHTSSAKIIIEASLSLFDRIIDKNLLIRKVNFSANNVVNEKNNSLGRYNQASLFDDGAQVEARKKELERERKIQETVLKLKKVNGKNIILKAKNLQEGATTMERNKQIGGHKA
ncbi:MAG: DNA methylase [Spirochaetales bacterium]|nr:DNA methylase [Spirochaetales bacterium]